MDFFGIGAMELLLILVLALLVVGPRRLPEAARKLAGMLREMRRMWTDVSTDFAKELSIDGASEDFRTIADTVGTLRHAGSPAKLLQDIVPKDVVTTLEGRPPSPAELLVGPPGAPAQVTPAAAAQAAAAQTAAGQASSAGPAIQAVLPPPEAPAGQASSDVQSGAADHPLPAAEPFSGVPSADGAETAAPPAPAGSEDLHGA